MGNFTYFLICSLIVTVAHFSNAGLIENRALKKAQLYYRVHPNFGGPKDIPLAEVEKFFIDGPVCTLIHGYIAGPDHDSISPVTQALMASGVCNVIVARWTAAASLTYPQSRGLIGDVGFRFFEILTETLYNLNSSLKKVTCYGHSLGAHICGNIGKASNDTLHKIIAMDAARPLIKSSDKDCLRKEDAQRVIAIHTSRNFGTLTPLGHLDVYVNYGRSQPGCLEPAQITDLVTKTNDCNHNRACQLTGESILAPYNIPAVRCDFEAIKKETPSKCLGVTENKVSRSFLQDELFNHSVSGDTIFFNPDIPDSISGTYITMTYSRSPYGKGAAYEVPADYA